MNNYLIVVGALVLVSSVFGYAYAEEQSGLVGEIEGIIQGENMDWALVSSISLAGIVLGLVTIIVGILPQRWYGLSEN